ncbi:MAG: HD domain-containing protein, partial [Deltaproteobacteria bacterium]|nr:HD domain-containing protein [Deltaproteobacteria bacterium]
LSDPDLSGKFKIAPAAKRFHHEYRGGLLEHTLSVAKGAIAICGLYPLLNRDLLLTGAIIHDLGKIREFDLGLSGDYTTEGRLIGHIVIGVEMLDSYLADRPRFDPQSAMLLKHMILSHHGEYDFGSPKKPKFLEALVLHYLDDLDAKMNAVTAFIGRHVNEQTGWTDYNQKLERFFFRPDLPRFASLAEEPEGMSNLPTDEIPPAARMPDDSTSPASPVEKPPVRSRRVRPAPDLCQPLFPDLNPGVDEEG